jgi:hypothetical protein
VRVALVTAPPARTPLRRRIRNILLALGLGVFLSLLAGELVLRLFLFHPNLELGGLGASIRQPDKYSDGNDEDDFWKLRCITHGPAAMVDAPGPDPITGWTGYLITPGSYEHVDEVKIHGRRPVILYGDSFAQCNTPPAECFQTILEHSGLESKYALVNYGVGGYGLDQIYLLLLHSIDRFKDRDPIVIVSVLLESDFDRTTLSFRDWPKPRLEIVNGSLVPRGPVVTDIRKFLEQNPISIRSYLWRFFLYHPANFLLRQRQKWRTDDALQQEKKRLNRRILVEIEHELSSRHLQHFFLVFHAEQGALKPWDVFAWQEQMIWDVAAEFSIPIVDTRPYLSFASDGLPIKCAQFYGHSGHLEGHHNAVGNLVCFEAIRQGLSGDFAAPDFEHLAEMKRRGLFELGAEEKRPITLLGRPATLVLHGSKENLRAVEGSDPKRLFLRADVLGQTKAVFDLSGEAKRFTGSLHRVRNPDQGCAGVDLTFEITVDGKTVLQHEVPPAADALGLDIDLAGRQSIALTIRGFGGQAGCEWACIDDPRLQ